MIRGYKGLRDLMGSFDDARPPRSDLLIAGTPKDGPLVAELEGWAATRPHVRLDLGLVPDARLVQYVAASDVIVLPFLSSLTSGSAILAASLSRPIIAPRTGCLAEFPAEAGLFYPAGNTQGLREALAAAESAPLDEMGAAAARYISGFPWSLSAQATAAVYAEVLNRNRSPARPRRESVS
jgi:beta-1,4-mannosyltransferase